MFFIPEHLGTGMWALALKGRTSCSGIHSATTQWWIRPFTTSSHPPLSFGGRGGQTIVDVPGLVTGVRRWIGCKHAFTHSIRIYHVFFEGFARFLPVKPRLGDDVCNSLRAVMKLIQLTRSLLLPVCSCSMWKDLTITGSLLHETKSTVIELSCLSHFLPFNILLLWS